MGGGDLNLKKSWHPSTQKNMEKVWKAEQQNNQEKKRIAELRREIEMERDREEIAEHAMQQGVIEKKDNKKLDWMYKGPNSTVDRDEYLLGKKIDKTFEESLQISKDAESNKIPKNHVEHECIPPSLRNLVGSEQVDVARKLQEDPLYAIKKRELESRAQLLKNPLKLKQLKEKLENGKRKSIKKSKKKSKDNLEDKLDILLADKYKKFKNEINAEDLIKELKNKRREKKYKKKKRQENHSSNSSNESSDSHSSSNSDIDREKRKKRNRNLSPDGKSSKRNYDKYGNKVKYEKHDNIKEKRDQIKYRSKTDYYDGKEKNHSKHTNYGLMKADGSKISLKSHSPCKSLKTIKKEEKRPVPVKRENLTDEEKRQRLKEMMRNAVIRDKERTERVKRYRKEEEKERSEKTFSKDFIRKELAKAADSSSLESRIKSNLNNIQRSQFSMNCNFARR